MSSLRSICTVVLTVSSFAVSALVCAQTKLDLGDALVVLNSDDKRYWQMDVDSAPLKQPRYPFELLRAGVSGCVSLGFFIETDGTSSGYRVLQSRVSGKKLGTKNTKIASALFSKASLESLVQARFVAGPENPSKRRAFTQITFSYSADTNPLKISCAISNLPVFLSAKEARAAEE